MSFFSGEVGVSRVPFLSDQPPKPVIDLSYVHSAIRRDRFELKTIQFDNFEIRPRGKFNGRI